MDREKLTERIDKLVEELSKHKPESKEYKEIADNLEKLWRLALEDEKVVNDRLDRNRRYDLEEMKYESEKREATRRDKSDKAKIAIEIGKGAMYIGGTILAMLVVATIEEQTIISPKVWSVIGWLKPKI